jgi:hypothetical protein
MNNPSTERIGVSKVENIFSRKGWFFREQHVKDYGIDAQVEIVDSNIPTGNLIAIQIKTGLSYFQEIKNEKIKFRIDNRHANYWLNHSLPVIVILYNPETDLALYYPVTDETVLRLGKSYKVDIPITNILDEEAFYALRQIYKLNFKSNRFNKLLLDRNLMEILKNDKDIFLEFYDWKNKSLSRTSIKFIFEQSNSLLEKSSLLYYFPNSETIDIVKNLVPWADLEMDFESFEEYKREQYENECFIYDKEDDITFFPMSFEEWYEEPADIVPIDSDPEKSFYRVKLSLNDIGTSFLTLINYLESDNKFEKYSFIYNDIRNT